MKTKIFTALALIAALSFASCGDEKGAESKEEGKDGEKKAELEVSDDMKHFMSHLNGDYESVEHALKEFASTDEIAEHDMGMYNLEEPVVLGRDGDCYDIECKSGQVKNKYTICWEGNKIASIEGE